MEQQKKSGLNIGKKTFFSTLIILAVIMVFAMALTQFVPQGSFDRAVVDGRSEIVPGTFKYVQADALPLWRFFTAPFEIFASEDATTAIMIIAFIMLIGGVFLILEKSGILRYAMQSLIARFGSRKYVLLCVLTLFSMFLGSVMGLFEETVVLAPILVALSVALGWDALVGIGMSALAVGMGFSAGTTNPFTVGIAQQLAELPLFSGIFVRICIFAAVYAILIFFLLRYAKKIEKNPEKSLLYGYGIQTIDIKNTEGFPPKVKQASVFFLCAVGAIILYIAAGFFIETLSSFTMPAMALLFTVGGLGAGLISGYSKHTFKDFLSGMLSLLPSALLIMLALSVKQIIVSGGIMDTLLQYTYQAMSSASPGVTILLLFLFVLLFDFFIGGASAKAFLVIPLVVPLADLVGFTRQNAVLAFCLGDGFSNMIFPTNAVLLITLGLIGVPYIKWFKWTWKVQLAMIALSVITLLLTSSMGYGPF